MKNFFYYLVR